MSSQGQDNGESGNITHIQGNSDNREGNQNQPAHDVPKNIFLKDAAVGDILIILVDKKNVVCSMVITKIQLVKVLEIIEGTDFLRVNEHGEDRMFVKAKVKVLSRELQMPSGHVLNPEDEHPLETFRRYARSSEEEKVATQRAWGMTDKDIMDTLVQFEGAVDITPPSERAPGGKVYAYPGCSRTWMRLMKEMRKQAVDSTRSRCTMCPKGDETPGGHVAVFSKDYDLQPETFLDKNKHWIFQAYEEVDMAPEKLYLFFVNPLYFDEGFSDRLFDQALLPGRGSWSRARTAPGST